MLIETIAYYVIAVLSVITLLWIGSFIGREFGSFENFAFWYIKYLKGEKVLPPYESGEPESNEASK